MHDIGTLSHRTRKRQPRSIMAQCRIQVQKQEKGATPQLFIEFTEPLFVCAAQTSLRTHFGGYRPLRYQ